MINNITAGRHVAYLLAALPSKIYNTMEELTAPELPEDVSYEELVVKLETLEIRKSSLISRYEFGKTYRGNEESIQTFAHRVIRAAQECNGIQPAEYTMRISFDRDITWIPFQCHIETFNTCIQFSYVDMHCIRL